MTAELDVLRDAVGRLEAAGISYMLTGSIALRYYAQPRMTRDIDLVVELQNWGAGQVAAIFAHCLLQASTKPILPPGRLRSESTLY